jgi:XTP/dITP diphosphohydrolase|tara:strand:+ start:5018 stop:5596 length:579 start_codon:yes stop_codon:yes gene_type:complete
MKIVFATNNSNKLEEIRNLVSKNINIISLSDIKCIEELPETQLTLEGNALQKANYIYSRYGFNCFADDTGLEIDALDGDPGVFSARYAGLRCLAKDNMNKVLSKLNGVSNRNAKFRTVIALIIDGNEYLFNGECLGEITTNKKGLDGFGYDPIFLPVNSELTFAQMSKSEKGLISHRGISVRKLVDFLSIRN